MTVKIACVVFDCLDALVVGRFWSAAIGRPLDPGASSEFASIGFHGRRDRSGWSPVERDADPTWLFARVPESKTVKNRFRYGSVRCSFRSAERCTGGNGPFRD
jgi:hypothetical protein